MVEAMEKLHSLWNWKFCSLILCLIRFLISSGKLLDVTTIKLRHWELLSSTFLKYSQTQSTARLPCLHVLFLLSIHQSSLKTNCNTWVIHTYNPETLYKLQTSCLFDLTSWLSLFPKTTWFTWKHTTHFYTCRSQSDVIGYQCSVLHFCQHSKMLNSIKYFLTHSLHIGSDAKDNCVRKTAKIVVHEYSLHLILKWFIFHMPNIKYETFLFLRNSTLYTEGLESMSWDTPHSSAHNQTQSVNGYGLFFFEHFSSFFFSNIWVCGCCGKGKIIYNGEFREYC